MSGGIRLTTPLPLTGAQLTSTNVTEAEYSAWAGVTTYALGARAIHNNSVWQSAQAGNVGHDPSTSGDVWWLRVGPTNRFAMFDLTKATPTTLGGDSYYEFALGKSINALHIIGLSKVESLRVRLTSTAAGLVYDSGLSPTGMVITDTSWWTFFYGPRTLLSELHYYDLPTYEDMTLRLDFYGGAGMSVGYVVCGSAQQYGTGVEYGARITSEAFGSTPRDQWGVPSLKKRPKARRLTFTLMHEDSELDDLLDRLDSADTEIALWNVYDGYRATKVLGTLNSADAVLSYYQQCQTSIEILGMPNA